MQIIKIGGSKITSRKSLSSFIDVVKNLHTDTFIIISAFEKTTKKLQKCLTLAASKQNYKQIFSQITDFHFNLVNHQHSPILNELFAELNDYLKAVETINNFTNKTIDLILSFGEKLAFQVCKEIFNDHKISCNFIDASTSIITNSDFTNADILFQQTKTHILKSYNPNIKLHLIQGFIGKNEEGTPTTLGMESSNYTAITIAKIFSADVLTLFSDTNGVLDSDPRVFSNPNTLKQISFEEAKILSDLGLKILSKKMLDFACEQPISIYYKSFFNASTDTTALQHFFPSLEQTLFIVNFDNETVLNQEHISTSTCLDNISLIIYNFFSFDYQKLTPILKYINKITINLHFHSKQVAIINLNKSILLQTFELLNANNLKKLDYNTFEKSIFDVIKATFNSTQH